MESAESGERDRGRGQVTIKHFELRSCLVGEERGKLAFGGLQFGLEWVVAPCVNCFFRLSQPHTALPHKSPCYQILN